MKKIFLITFAILITASSLWGQRIKDLSYFKGVASEQLIGYGLVVGLAGTGDTYRSLMTEQSIKSMLNRFGITVSDKKLRTRNVCAVMITARVTNLLKPGAEFDVVVSSMGDATSLLGGQLLLTPLSRRDGNVVGISQGAVSIGGYDIKTRTGGRVARNHALSGRIPGGGFLENELQGGDIYTEELSILLREPDFTTSNNIVNAVNTTLGDGTASAVGAAEIKITVPQGQENIGAFIAQLEAIEVQKDVAARVILNERTGTIVAGSTVRISPVTIAHGSLNITIRSFPIISQPTPFSMGETKVFNNLVPTVQQEGNNAIAIQGASNVDEVAAALNSLQVSPRDIIAIFQALK